MAENYTPSDGMKSAARRALKWKDEGRRGGTQVGLTRAHQIVSGENLSASTVKRMYSFFSRHEVDKKATGFNSGEEGFPSPGRVAWDLWGGDAGFSWSRQKVNSMDKSNEIIEGNLNPRQEFLYEAIEMAVEQFGMFDMSTGANGIHYASADKNPFKSEGLMCKNCVFYEEGACELVTEPVEEEAVCKFWIIPDNLIIEKRATKSMNKEEAIKELRDFVSEITKSEDVTTATQMAAETALTGENISFSDPEAATEDDDLRLQGTGHVDTEEENSDEEMGTQEIANDVREQGSFWGGFFGR